MGDHAKREHDPLRTQAKTKYRVRDDGEWFHIPRHGNLIGCCDCKLVHLFKARVRKGRVEISAVRMVRNTASRRAAEARRKKRLKHKGE